MLAACLFACLQVTITPEVPKKVSREVMNKLRATYGAAEFKGKRGAYDGEKSLFTSGPLNFNQQEYPVFLDDERGPSFKCVSPHNSLGNKSFLESFRLFCLIFAVKFCKMCIFYVRTRSCRCAKLSSFRQILIIIISVGEMFHLVLF